MTGGTLPLHSLCPQDFFFTVSICVTHDRPTKIGTSHSVLLFGFNKELYPLAPTHQQVIKLFHISICYTVAHEKKHLICFIFAILSVLFTVSTCMHLSILVWMVLFLLKFLKLCNFMSAWSRQLRWINLWSLCFCQSVCVFICYFCCNQTHIILIIS